MCERHREKCTNVEDILCPQKYKPSFIGFYLVCFEIRAPKRVLSHGTQIFSLFRWGNQEKEVRSIKHPVNIHHIYDG